MTAPPDPTPAIHRLVVLVDASRASRAALEEAAGLAARRGLELLGLFVEEEDLLRSAGLPFAGEIGPTSAALRPLDPVRLEHRLRAHARELQGLLRGLTRRYAITASLEVARGQVVSQALAHISPGDLVVVGKTGWSTRHPGRLGSIPRRLVEQGALTVMVLDEAVGTEVYPTMALFDDAEAGERALETAIQIARRDGQTLIVLLPPAAPALLADLRERAARWLEGRGVEAELRVLEEASPEAIARAVRQEGGWSLVVSRASPCLAGDAGSRLIEAVSPPVVVVP